VISPVILLTVYTFVFTVVFEARWQLDIGGRGEFALILFAGLIVYQFFAECIGRAPRLLLENPSYIKKVVFPLESLAWISVGAAGFGMVINFCVLVLAHLLLAGLPPLTLFLLPLILLPFVLMVVGLSWFLSATGIYLRDLGQFIGVILPLLLFASAVFFPIDAVPEPYRSWLYLNPLVHVIEMARGALLFGRVPSFIGFALFLGMGVLVAWLGLAWFSLTRRGFADVV
jgi:lipopolysaccharide transport system permease protein